MRHLTCLALAALLSSSIPASPATAQNLDSGAQQLAATVFHAADGNRNEWLNGTEFKKAEGLLYNAILTLGRQGTIGKKNAKESEGGRGATASANPDPDGDEKITLAEYTAYVRAILSNADEAFRKARERYERQREAARKRAQQQNKRRRRRRR